MDTMPLPERGDLDQFIALRRRLFYPKADHPIAQATSDSLELQTTLEHLQQLCQLHFHAQAESIVPFADPGTFHRLFHLVLPQGRNVVARLNAHSLGMRDYPLLFDVWVSEQLRRVSLPALEVFVVDLTRRHAPWDYEFLELAAGVSLKRFDHDDHALAPLLTQLGAFLARVHRIEGNGYGLLVPAVDTKSVCGSCLSWAAYLDNHLDRHLAVCRDIQAIGAEEVQTISKRFAKAAPWLEPVSPTLLHGDPGNHNVFVEGTRVTALIDWEDALFGDPVYEVAFWATFHPERRHGAFLKGYLAGRAPSDEFLTRFWLYFLRVALAKTVVRHNLGLQDRPDRPRASLRIQRGLQGLDQSRRAA